MRKVELEEGVAYTARHHGKVTVVDKNPTDARGKSRMVLVRQHGDSTGYHREGSTFLCSPALLLRRWDDPEEVAKRERRAELDAQSARARELLATLGLTVATPGRPRALRHPDLPDPESWVEGAFDGRRVVIRLDAFLRLFTVSDLAAVVRELEYQRASYDVTMAEVTASMDPATANHP